MAYSERSERGKRYWREIETVVKNVKEWHRVTGRNSAATELTKHDWNRVHSSPIVKRCWKLLLHGPISAVVRKRYREDLTYSALLDAVTASVESGHYSPRFRPELAAKDNLITEDYIAKHIKHAPFAKPEKPAPAPKPAPPAPKSDFVPERPRQPEPAQQTGPRPTPKPQLLFERPPNAPTDLASQLRITIWYISMVGGPQKAKELIDRMTTALS